MSLGPKLVLSSSIGHVFKLPSEDAPQEMVPDAGTPTAAKQATPEAPRPLIRKLSPADEFPIEALGGVMRDAAKAINDIVRAPLAIGGQSAMAAATLAVQGHGDIELPTGQINPISEFYVTVAESGERKTASDKEALLGVRKREAELREEYAATKPKYDDDMIAWEKARDHAIKGAKGNQSAIKFALSKIGPPPPAPLLPLLTCPEPTMEGLVKALAIGQPSIGIFSDEGGQFIGGHGMKADAKARTAAALSDLWQAKAIVRVRSSDGTIILPGRRGSAHLMAQPGIAAMLLADPLLIDQGLISRCLTTAPEPASGSRFWREPQSESFRALEVFKNTILEILRMPLPLAAGKTNELSPPVMRMSAEATKLWKEYADKIERQLAPGCALVPIKSLANKLPEHSSRIAAALALIANIDSRVLSAEFAANGILLAEHYCAEALRLFEAGQVSPELALAQKLLNWLHGLEEPNVSLPDIYQNGPNAIRDKATASRLVGVLEDHGWLKRVSGGAEVAGHFRRDVWAIVRE